MTGKLKYTLLGITFFVIVGTGFICVSNSLPGFIKDKSSIKTTFSEKPFNFRVETKKYIISLNQSDIENTKDSIEKTAEGIADKTSQGINSLKKGVSNLISNFHN